MTAIMNITLQNAFIDIKSFTGLKTFVTLNLGGHSQDSPVSKGQNPEWSFSYTFHRKNEGFILVSLTDKGLFSDSTLAEGIILLESLVPFRDNPIAIPLYKYNLKKADINFNIYIDSPLERQQSNIIRQKIKENIIIASPISQPDQSKSSKKVADPVPAVKKPEVDLITYGIQLSDLTYDKLIYTSQSAKQEIYLGRINSINASVAIKVSYCDGNDEFNRVQREAMAISQLDHPHICRVYGTLLDITGGRLKNLIILENCEGVSLRHEIESRLKQNQPFTEEEVQKFMADLIGAFAYIQSKHIVHSDIKPDNIMISPGRVLKVIDFGISLHGYAELFETTKTLKVGGTIPYFSPLQLQGYLAYIQGINSTCTVRHNPIKSDVYSLGLTFLHLTTLNPPNGLNNSDSGLQGRILNAVSGLGYSESIKETIMRMLTIEEEFRPDFLTLASDFKI